MVNSRSFHNDALWRQSRFDNQTGDRDGLNSSDYLGKNGGQPSRVRRRVPPGRPARAQNVRSRNHASFRRNLGHRDTDYLTNGKQRWSERGSTHITAPGRRVRLGSRGEHHAKGLLYMSFGLFLGNRARNPRSDADCGSAPAERRRASLPAHRRAQGSARHRRDEAVSRRRRRDHDRARRTHSKLP